MKTFLDRPFSHSYLLWGRMTDRIVTSDLMCVDLDTYLVQLLKKNGYRHIIFYGTEGARGAYTLDYESARWYFNDNQHLSPFKKLNFKDFLEHLEQKLDTTKETIEISDDDDDDDDDDIMMNAFGKGGRGYHPRERNRKTVKKTEKTETKKQESKVPTRVRYALRNMTPEVFIPDIRMRLHDRNEQDTALVFYDAYNLVVNYPSFLHDILMDMEQMDLHNICLFQMENNSEQSIVSRLVQDPNLRQSGFTGKFVSQEGNDYILNPSTTVHIGYPTVDEIVNYLRRLTLIGTPGKRYIDFNYTELHDIAKELFSCSRQYVFGKIEQEQSMRELMNLVNHYIDSHVQPHERLPISVETIRAIYDADEEPDYLEELNKPGWEEAYRVVKTAVDAYKVLHPVNQRGYSTDFKIERLSDEAAINRKNVEIPNFVIQGPSGTGKSEIGEIIGKVLKQNNILEIGRFNKISKADLTNIYVNSAERYTREQIERSEESVLFIDEVESFADQDGGVNHTPTGVSIIRTLNHALTSSNHHFSLIIAGYDKDMDNVLNLDQGFRRRFKGNIITLKDYEPDLLMTIFIEKVTQHGGTLDGSLLEDGALLRLMTSIYHNRDRRNFGNGGEMEALADQVYARCQSRPVRQEDFYGLSANSRTIDESWFEDINANDSIDQILDELDHQLIGMKSVRQELINLANLIEDAQANHRPIEELRANSVKLIGNPGTGKTEVGKLLGRLYFQLGLTGTPENVNCDAGDLASMYRGETTVKFKEYIEEARSKNALLFVDEASSLSDDGIDGAGAVTALLGPTTDKVNPLVCAVALYPDKEKGFDALNPGASRRFRRIVIEDYTGEELFAIIKLMMKKKELSTDDECDDELKRICDYVHEVNDANHRNAGEMQTILEDMNSQRIQRCKDQGIDLASSEAKIFVKDDLPSRYVDTLPPKDESPLDVLRQMAEDIEARYVGFDDIIEHLRDIAYSVNYELEEGHSVYHMPLSPLIVAGNTGTGKTTIFRLMGDLYYRLHVVSSREPIMISSDALMSTYMNGGKEETKKVINEAREGNRLLIVDECHQLLNGTDNRTGKEIIQTFLAPMTDDNKPLRVIFGIYEANLDQFLNLDPGFGNRFDANRMGGRSRNIIHLHDYTGEELYQIFLKMAESKGYKTTDELNAIVENYCKALYEHRTTNSGNARQIKNFIDDMIITHKQQLNSTNRKLLDVDDLAPDIISRYSPESMEQELERLTSMLEKIDHERVGNGELKDEIKRLIKTAIFNKKFPQRAKVIEPGHYFFKGNPGAGKTTSVEMLERYLRELGLLTRKYRKHGASDLVAGYIGQTALKTREVLESGFGCITLIDEAYILADQREGAFSREAIAELVRFMDDEQYRRNSCLIFAGYPGDMDGLYKINPGLKSRIKEITFPDYSTEECIEIFKYMASKDQIEVEEDAQAKVNDIIAIIHEENEFANGRTIRELYGAIVERVQDRIINATEELPMNITIEDIPSMADIIKACNLR